MDDSSFKLSMTAARQKFKKLSGHNNHYIITCLVGLNGVKEGKVRKDPEFSTSWNPKDVTSSAMRSRNYVLHSSLVWIADLRDAYTEEVIRNELATNPEIFKEEDVSELGNIRGRRGKGDQKGGRAEELKYLCKMLGIDDSASQKAWLSLVLASINLRNEFVHTFSTRTVDPDLKRRLTESKVYIHDNFNNLDVEILMKRWGRSYEENLSFKECLSYIQATDKLVREIDNAICTRILPDKKAESCLQNYFQSFTRNGDKKNSAVINRKAQEIWGDSSSMTIKHLCKVLEQYHLQLNNEEGTYIREIASLSWEDAVSRFAIEPSAES